MEDCRVCVFTVLPEIYSKALFLRGVALLFDNVLHCLVDHFIYF